MTWEAESLRRRDFECAVTRTAARYPHLSIAALARLYQAGPTDVWRVLSAADIERPRRSSCDEFTPESVKIDLDAGLSVAAMCRKYDVSEAWLRQVMRPLDIPRQMPEEVAPVTTPVEPDPVPGDTLATQPPSAPRKSQPRRFLPDPAPVASLRAKGLTWEAVARHLGCAVSTAHRVAKIHDLLGGPAAAQRWLDDNGLVATVPAAAEPPITAGEVPTPEADETLVRCVRRGLSGAAAKSLLERLSWVPADDCRYDVQIIVREVV